MFKCSESPIVGLCIGALAAVGVASIAMMMTNRGRHIIVNLCSCASSCTKKVGNAAEDIATELRDSFLSSCQSMKSDCDCGCSDSTASAPETK